MKKTLPIHRAKALPATAIALCSFLILAPSSRGVVTVHFDEIGNDVRVSFDGTIALAPSEKASFFGGINYMAVAPNSVFMWSSDPNTHEVLMVGTPSPTLFNFTTSIITPVDGGASSFGFEENWNLLYLPRHVSLGISTRLPLELTAVATEDFFFLRDTDVSELTGNRGGGIAEGATLWTANGTGDTFVFASSIPEPSGVMSLGALLGLGIMFRTRR